MVRRCSTCGEFVLGCSHVCDPRPTDPDGHLEGDRYDDEGPEEGWWDFDWRPHKETPGA